MLYGTGESSFSGKASAYLIKEPLKTNNRNNSLSFFAVRCSSRDAQIILFISLAIFVCFLVIEARFLSDVDVAGSICDFTDVLIFLFANAA